jgi:hypothetical protein
VFVCVFVRTCVHVYGWYGCLYCVCKCLSVCSCMYVRLYVCVNVLFCEYVYPWLRVCGVCGVCVCVCVGGGCVCAHARECVLVFVCGVRSVLSCMRMRAL